MPVQPEVLLRLAKKWGEGTSILVAAKAAAYHVLECFCGKGIPGWSRIIARRRFVEMSWEDNGEGVQARSRRRDDGFGVTVKKGGDEDCRIVQFVNFESLELMSRMAMVRQ
jgi:hypothetical protein